MKKSNHIDQYGNVRMVNISDKSVTLRKAVAIGTISVNSDVISSIKNKLNKKGDVLAVSQVAGIQAAKNTSSLIPLTHQILLKSVTINFEIIDLDIICTCEVISEGKTGVEIEALFATEVALLTIYDMCKYIDRNMIIKEVKLLMKKGGKSGDFKREKFAETAKHIEMILISKLHRTFLIEQIKIYAGEYLCLYQDENSF